MVTLHSLSDVADPRISDFRNLTDVELRRVKEPAEGIYIAESLKVLERALRAGHEPLSIVTSEQWLPQLEALCGSYPEVTLDTPVFVGSESILEAITGFHVHRGTLACLKRPPLPSLQEILDGQRLVVVLEDIVDHTNVGAIFRSVAGLGAGAVIVSAACADPLYRRSVRVSMGTVMQIPWTRADSWHDISSVLHDSGFSVVALALEPGAVELSSFVSSAPEKIALVLGSEGDGVSREALDTADYVVSIPMHHGVDSLNVAAASAVAMWALGQR
ncbi:MAG: hypothetical protein RL187_66 [Actinomycetota bacterium]